MNHMLLRFSFMVIARDFGLMEVLFISLVNIRNNLSL